MIFLLNFKRLSLTAILIISAGLMSGCSGVRYGIANSYWKALSLVERKEMRADYRRIRAFRVEEKRKQDRLKITASTPKLRLTIKGGEVHMPPFDKAYAYEPATLILYQGQCQSVMLVEEEGERKTELEACYHDSILYLDPSRYEYEWRYGSLRFYYVPIWQSGFTYTGINSEGYASLEDATITIKALVPPKK